MPDVLEDCPGCGLGLPEAKNPALRRAIQRARDLSRVSLVPAAARSETGSRALNLLLVLFLAYILSKGLNRALATYHQEVPWVDAKGQRVATVDATGWLTITDRKVIVDGKVVHAGGRFTNNSNLLLLNAQLITLVRDNKGNPVGTALGEVAAVAAGQTVLYGTRGQLDKPLQPGKTLTWTTKAGRLLWASK